MTAGSLPRWRDVTGQGKSCRGCADHMQIARTPGVPMPRVRPAVWELTDRKGQVTCYCQPCRDLYGAGSEL